MTDEKSEKPESAATTSDNDKEEEKEATTSDNDKKEEKEVKQQTPTKSLELHHEWTLWFDNPKLAPPGSDWSDNLKNLATFRTVPDFWKVYNNVLPPSMIGISSNYSIFRKGVLPAWEHPENLEGGKFVLTLPKPKSNNSNNSQNNNKGGVHGGTKDVPKLDEYWLFTILAVLGETMDATGDQVCGAVVSVRKSQDRVALWLKTGDQALCVRIGERWKKALDLEKTTLRYQTHKDAAATGRSFRIDVHFEV